MVKRQFWTGAAAFIGMMILILDSRTALSGAKEGISLCLMTIIPSLFPFFVLNAHLMRALSGRAFSVLRPLCRLCGIPAGYESILIPAFLGGYPAGAQSTAQLWKENRIPKETAQRMLSFTNNAGPSFIFGMAGMFFNDIRMVWTLWLIQIISALLTGIIYPKYSSAIPEGGDGSTQRNTDVLTSSIRAITLVCSWVILFRIMLAFLSRWFLWILPTEGQTVITGILELSNGCCALDKIANEALRFVVCSGLLSFGGLCVMLQTAAVCKGLSLRHYMLGKLLQTLFSVTISAQIAYPSGAFLPSIVLFVSIYLLSRQIRGRFPRKAIV